MSPLTSDERGEAADALRHPREWEDEDRWALADKLEAEPELAPVMAVVKAAKRVGLECRDEGYVGRVERERDEARDRADHALEEIERIRALADERTGERDEAR